MEKELSKLQVMKHEYQERSSALNDECTRLKETEVSINLLSVLLNNLTQWYDSRDCGNGDDFHLRIKGFWISPLTWLTVLQKSVSMIIESEAYWPISFNSLHLKRN